MSTKKYDQEINVYHNGMEKFIAYKNSSPEWEFVIYNRASGPTDTFVCATDDRVPSVHNSS